VTATEQTDWATYLKRLISDDRELAQTVIVAAQLGIADLLAGGPQPTTELALRTGTHPPSLYRLLRYLASRGVFAEGADGQFALTTRAEPLRSDSPSSIQVAARWNGSDAYQRTWTTLPTVSVPDSRRSSMSTASQLSTTSPRTQS
jgi:hypothetical protein